jgi:hypothetical protein
VRRWQGRHTALIELQILNVTESARPGGGLEHTVNLLGSGPGTSVPIAVAEVEAIPMSSAERTPPLVPLTDVSTPRKK